MCLVELLQNHVLLCGRYRIFRIDFLMCTAITYMICTWSVYECIVYLLCTHSFCVADTIYILCLFLYHYVGCNIQWIYSTHLYLATCVIYPCCIWYLLWNLHLIWEVNARIICMETQRYTILPFLFLQDSVGEKVSHELADDDEFLVHLFTYVQFDQTYLSSCTLIEDLLQIRPVMILCRIRMYLKL